MKDITNQESAPPAPPCIFVIFGAGGDLTKRKLLPALYNLATQRLLPERFAIVGVDRADYDSDGFRAYLDSEALPPRDFSNYAAGSWGPVAADELLTEDRRNWHGCTVCV